MKYLFPSFILMLFVAQKVVGQEKTISFSTSENPVAEVSNCYGETIGITGVVHRTIFDGGNRILVIGKIGIPPTPDKFSTELTVVIFQQDIEKFKDDSDKSLLYNSVFIAGKVIHYKGKVALRLRFLKDIQYIKERPPVIR